MPNALAIGVPYELFWELNPHKLKAFYKAYEIHKKILDEEMWIMGAYVNNAVLSAVEHNLAGKKAKTKYLEQPFLKQEQTEELKQAEKMKQVKALFTALEIKKANFELSKGSTK